MADKLQKYPLAPREEWYGEANYQETGGRLVEMTPDEFLTRVRPLKIDEISRDNIDDLKSHMESGRTLDPLQIYKEGIEDGRHRAHAARELGIEKVPVLTWDIPDEPRPPDQPNLPALLGPPEEPGKKPSSKGGIFRGIGSLMRRRIFPLIQAAQASWGALSPEAKAEVEAFLKRPAHELVGMEKPGIEYFKEWLDISPEDLGETIPSPGPSQEAELPKLLVLQDVRTGIADISDRLKSAFPDKNIEITHSKTEFGSSSYLSIDGREIRVSDHAFTSPRRIEGEIITDSRSFLLGDDVGDDIDSLIKTIQRKDVQQPEINRLHKMKSGELRKLVGDYVAAGRESTSQEIYGKSFKDLLEKGRARKTVINSAEANIQLFKNRFVADFVQAGDARRGGAQAGQTAPRPKAAGGFIDKPLYDNLIAPSRGSFIDKPLYEGAY